MISLAQPARTEPRPPIMLMVERMNMLDSNRSRRIVGDWVVRGILIAGGFFLVLPLLWMITTALKDDYTLENDPSSWRISTIRMAS